MRWLGSAARLGGGQEVALPAGVEELLVQVVTDGFTLYRCGPKDAPRALVACYQWTHHVDLLTVRDFARVITARVPTLGLPVDIFAPEVVVWAYEGSAQHAVRALLELVHPAHPDGRVGHMARYLTCQVLFLVAPLRTGYEEFLITGCMSRARLC